MRTQPTKPLLQLLVAAATLLTLGATAQAASPTVGALPTGPLTGSLEVDNARRRPVGVFVDGQHLGEVRARSSQVFQVANGVRLVSYGGPGGFTTERIRVPVDGRATLRVTRLVGHAFVRNGSGVPMRLTLSRLGGRRDLPPAKANLGLLRPGERVETQPLRPGTYQLTAAPAGRFAAAPPVTRELEITPGERQRVRLRPYLATVTVTNPFRRAARLFVDGQPVGRLRPGAQLVLSDQLPGLHHLELRKRGRVLADTRLSLTAGESQLWQPLSQRLGELRLRNDTRATLTVVVAGRTIGALAPGEATLVSDLTVGLVSVVAEGRRVRRITETVEIRPDRLTHLNLRAPDVGAGWGNFGATATVY